MNRRNTALFVVLAVVAGLAWLAYGRFPNIAYLTGTYELQLGLGSSACAAWPVYALILSLAALIGLLIGAWVVKAAASVMPPRRWPPSKKI